MRRVMAKMAAVAALALVACSEPEQPDLVELRGTLDAKEALGLLFLTSATDNALRIFDLALEEPRFVQAPNPLEPLAIPVLDQPAALERDVRFDGEIVSGPYVYARSPGRAEVSIVSARREDLRELFRLPLPAPVTAFAARGPSTGEGVSVLYVATVSGLGSELYRVEVPPPASARETSGAALVAAARRLADWPTQIARSIVVLPEGRLGIGLSASGGGGAVLLDEATGTQEGLSFGGPVTSLVTHGAVGDLPAGQRIYGILDSGGVLAVDVGTREVVKDASGFPMTPIRGAPSSGDEPAQLSLAIGTRVPTYIPGAEGATESGDGVLTLDLLGVIGTASQDLHFFDARWPRAIDVDSAKPSITAIAYRGPPTEAAPEGAPIEPYVAGPVFDRPETELNEFALCQNGTEPEKNCLFRLADGAARDERITLTYQAAVPGLMELPTSDDDQARFPVPAEVLARAGVGDRLSIRTSSGVCAEELVVTAVEASGLVTQAPPQSPCIGRVSFTVLADGAKPFVVQGTSSGYMGRTGPGDSFRYDGAYFRHPDGFDPATPQVAFEFGATDPAIVRGARYVIETADRFSPYTAFVGASETALGKPCPRLTFTSAVVLYGGEAYITYPARSGRRGEDGFVRFEPKGMRPSPPANTLNRECYR